MKDRREGEREVGGFVKGDLKVSKRSPWPVSENSWCGSHCFVCQLRATLHNLLALEVFMSVYIELFGHHVRVFAELKLSMMCLAVPIMQSLFNWHLDNFFFLTMLTKQVKMYTKSCSTVASSSGDEWPKIYYAIIVACQLQTLALYNFFHIREYSRVE